MKKKEDFLRAIGSADPRFEQTLHHTLEKMRRDEEEKPVKKIHLSVALVLVIILIAAVAVAAVTQWGVLDFVTNRSSGQVLPDAPELVQQSIPQQGGHTEAAAFSLREAVFDGKELYVVIAVKPADDDVLLLGADALPSDPAGNMGPLFEGEQQTIMDWAGQNEKNRLLHTNIYDTLQMQGIEGHFGSMDHVLEADGTLVYMLSGACETLEESLPVSLICSVTPFADISAGDELDIDSAEETNLSFELRIKQAADAVVSQSPVTFADCGVRVDSLTLSGTAMAVHVRIVFTITDEAAYAKTGDSLWFECLDADGNTYPDGPSGGSVSAEADGTLVQEVTLAAMEKLPERMTLRGYNVWEKNRYEAHEILLTPVE